MEHLLRSVEQAVEQKNWYAALMLALTLPEICAKVDGNTGRGRKPYLAWAERWIEPIYTKKHRRNNMLEVYRSFLHNRQTLEGSPFEGLNDLRSQIKTWDEEISFLKAGDLYALRCAFCHQGSHDLGEHEVREVLDRFHISEPPANGGIIHCNMGDRTLQIQVDIFCLEICDAVRKWLASTEATSGIKERMAKLSRIHSTLNF